MNLGTTRLLGRRRNRWEDERGWKNGWWRRMAGRNTEQIGMEEARKNDKESSHSAHTNGMNE
jgi:hypothetical protein